MGKEGTIIFRKLNVAVTTAPVVTLPTSTDTFILDTDALDFAIRAKLLQIELGMKG